MPAQIVVCEADMLMVGKNGWFTVIAMVLEVAVNGDAQPALEVSWQVTCALFASVLLAKVVEVCPVTFTPFTFH